jgi:hypothetical protein
MHPNQWPPHTALIPPFHGADSASGAHSPFPTAPEVFASSLGFTSRRVEILRGFFAVRARLRVAGITEAIQWVDGSFVEHKEQLLSEAPGDIDVVTWVKQLEPDCVPSILAELPVIITDAKEQHDTHLFVMEPISIEIITYWHGLFSHQRRTQRWKGFLSLPLTANHQEDAAALAWLEGKR